MNVYTSQPEKRRPRAAWDLLTEANGREPREMFFSRWCDVGSTQKVPRWVGYFGEGRSYDNNGAAGYSIFREIPPKDVDRRLRGGRS